MDWFLYDNGFRHERVKAFVRATKITEGCLFIVTHIMFFSQNTSPIVKKKKSNRLWLQ